jgi:tetratricopeptide (TPR) repeat protein
MGYESLVAWLSGRSDQARELTREAERLARTIGDPFALGWTLNYGSMALVRMHALDELKARIAESAKIAAEQGFYVLGPNAQIFQGWIDGEEGKALEGARSIREASDALERGGQRNRDFLEVMLADTLLKADRPAEALDAARSALDYADRSGIHSHLAEMQRLAGRAHEAMGELDEAESAYRRALDVARRQEARGWELRAATDLASRWTRREKRSEARELLAPVYGAFTEGLATPDLVAASELLDELA